MLKRGDVVDSAYWDALAREAIIRTQGALLVRQVELRADGAPKLDVLRARVRSALLDLARNRGAGPDVAEALFAVVCHVATLDLCGERWTLAGEKR